MPSTGLAIGPLRLNEDNVEAVVNGALPGAYALGRMRGRSFVVNFVGRADDNVREDLLDHARRGKYKMMRFDYCASAETAFQRECEIYHDFGAAWLLDNKKHPAPAEGQDWRCPRCKKTA